MVWAAHEGPSFIARAATVAFEPEIDAFRVPAGDPLAVQRLCKGPSCCTLAAAQWYRAGPGPEALLHHAVETGRVARRLPQDFARGRQAD